MQNSEDTFIDKEARMQWEQFAKEMRFCYIEKPRKEVELPYLCSLKPNRPLPSLSEVKITDQTRKFVDSIFNGAAIGQYNSFDFSIFYALCNGEESENSHYVHIILPFKSPSNINLAIKYKSLWDDIISIFKPSATIKFPENKKLNKLITVKTDDINYSKKLFTNILLQNALYNLFSFSWDTAIYNNGIHYYESGTIIAKEQALKVMELMSSVAAFLQS